MSEPRRLTNNQGRHSDLNERVARSKVAVANYPIFLHSLSEVARTRYRRTVLTRNIFNVHLCAWELLEVVVGWYLVTRGISISENMDASSFSFSFSSSATAVSNCHPPLWEINARRTEARWYYAVWRRRKRQRGKSGNNSTSLPTSLLGAICQN